MGKLIHVRYEYAQYDDAQGTLSPGKDIPPTYPPTLDQYRVNTVAAAAQAYGTVNVVGTTAPVAVSTPPLATVNISSPVANTTLLGIQVTAAIPSLNAAPVTLLFYCAPGQTITVPSTINSGTLSIGAYTLALSQTSAAFMATLTWHL